MKITPPIEIGDLIFFYVPGENTKRSALILSVSDFKQKESIVYFKSIIEATMDGTFCKFFFLYNAITEESELSGLFVTPSIRRAIVTEIIKA